MKSDCDFPLELLNAFIDNELGKKDKGIVKNHINKCPICKKRLRELKRIDKYLRNSQIEKPSREFTFDLANNVMSEIKGKRKKHILRFVFVPASVLVLILIFFIYYYTNVFFEYEEKKNMPTIAEIEKNIKKTIIDEKYTIPVIQAEKGSIPMNESVFKAISDTSFKTKKDKTYHIGGKEVIKLRK